MEIEAAMRDAGFETGGPALSFNELAALIATEIVGCVIFDVGMMGERTLEMLAPLVQRGTPLLYLTGCDDGDLPGDLPPGRMMRKPSGLSDVVASVRSLLNV